MAEIDIESFTKEELAKAADGIKGAIKEGQTLAGFYDVDLYVECYDQNGTYLTYMKVTEIGEPVSLTLPVPNGLPALKEGWERIWKVIRFHNGTAEVLDGELTANGVNTKSANYSTYALVYEDVKVTSNPKTGDTILIYVAILAVSTIAGVAIVVKSKKRNN